MTSLGLLAVSKDVLSGGWKPHRWQTASQGAEWIKKRRDYNEIELAMTRIGLFIIPLAGERKRERAREGDKADKKKCVVAGPARHLPTRSNGRQPMHAYHFHGYQRGLLSGDFTIKTASANPVQRAKHAFNSEVTVSVNLANQNQGQHKKTFNYFNFYDAYGSIPKEYASTRRTFLLAMLL